MPGSIGLRSGENFGRKIGLAPAAKRGRRLVGVEIPIDLAAENDRRRGKAYSPGDGQNI